ncbi:MAG: TniQ family protein [Aurantimonas endophytica]|uniref:TniQ family protein n=1 Tax=Aurantimonas endophytica TaxID=1522175 RepID=UPI003002F349
MAALSITVPFHDGETPVSFGSRLAQANGRDRVRDFALDVGLDFAGVVAGRPAALARLADMGGCCSLALASWAAVTGADGTTLRGENLGWRNLRRSRVFACPSCLLADLRDETLEPEVRVWGRAIWQVPALRTCRVHGQELVEIAHADDPTSLHDFASLALSRADDLVDLDAASERRAPSDFEAYVHDRLSAGPSGTRFLDGFPLHAVMRLSENLGVVMTFGRKVRLDDLGERDLHQAGARGFASASVGEAGIRAALVELQSTFFDGVADWGPKAMFGRFYEWLAHENADPVYDPVRDIVERHVVETMPIGPGEAILGREVTVRRIHSLHSASIEYGMHPKRLRKLLVADGLIKSEDAGRSDERVLFPVEAVSARLATLSDTFSLTRAGQYLNAPRPHERLLFAAGFIQPVVTGGTDVLKDHAIRRADLDDFIAKLTASARLEVAGGLPIPTAANRANCSAMEVVRLLLDSRLANVGIDGESRGYLSVLVDPDEVKGLVRKEDHGGLSLRTVEKRMSWSTKVVTSLIDRCLLTCTVAVNPVKRCPQRVVLESDLLAFDESFVSLHSLAKERGVHFRKLKAELVARGVAPDPAFADVPASFYRRADIGNPPT